MASPFSPRDPFGPTGPIGPTPRPLHTSPASAGWESRHAWEVALLLHEVPLPGRERLTAALPSLLPLARPWQTTRTFLGHPALPEWALVKRQPLTARELAVSPAELRRQFDTELWQGLRTLVTPEWQLGRGHRNGLLDAQRARLGQLWAALVAQIGFRPALEHLALWWGRGW